MQDYDPNDFPISVSSSGAGLAGTIMYMGEAVLSGQPDTISTQLEGLFISLLSLSCDGKLAGRRLLSIMPVSVWALTRSGALRCMHLPEDPDIAPKLQPLVRRLHGLFYPMVQGCNQRIHNEAVQPSEFQSVCPNFIMKPTATPMQSEI